MVKFIGEYSAKVDDKGRLIFPSAFKNLASIAGVPCQFVVKKDIFSPCLEMWTYEEWERQSEQLKSRLNFLNADHAKFWRGLMRHRALVTPDEKTGRILIPKSLLEQIGESKEVVFCGADHKIEIWAKDTFAQSEISNEEYLNLAQSLSNL